MKKFVGIMGFLLLSATVGWAQAAQPQDAGAAFTVLSNNADTANDLLFVEIMYEKPICGDAQAKFRLSMAGNRAGVSIAIDSVLNNHSTYTLSADKKTFSRPQAAGYRLRFDIADYELTSLDTPYICVESHRMADLCPGCAAGGSDAIFAETSINTACPYNRANFNDIIACYERKDMGGGRWEAWIKDSRDCTPYRIVYMPDNRWWFAQNLYFRENLTNNGNANNVVADSGTYWHPGGSAVPKALVAADTLNATAASFGIAAGGYGILYSWKSAMAKNGRSLPDAPTPDATSSTTQGICPDGWYLPSDFDFTALFNAVESRLGGAGNHGGGTGWLAVNSMVAMGLKTTLSCRPHSSRTDTVCANASRPAWSWRRADVMGKVASPLALGVDWLGFSALPAGFRNSTGEFYELGMSSYWWTSTQLDNTDAYFRGLSYKERGTRRDTFGKITHGLSVRCIRGS